MSERRIEIIRGDDVNLELTFTDIDGNAIDLTGGTVYFTVKKHLGDSDDDAVLQAEENTFTAPETGIMILTIGNEDTDLPIGQYYYDVQLKDLDNKISSSERGSFIVVKDITVRTD